MLRLRPRLLSRAGRSSPGRGCGGHPAPLPERIRRGHRRARRSLAHLEPWRQKSFKEVQNCSLEPFLFHLPNTMYPPCCTHTSYVQAYTHGTYTSVHTRLYRDRGTFPRASRDSEELIRTDTTEAVVTVKFSNSTPTPALAGAGAGYWELLLHFPPRQLIPLNSLGFTPQHLLTARIKPPL